MKVIKPTKLPILHRVVEIRRLPYFHVAGVLSFPLASPRALLDEMTFWQVSASALGERGVFDEGFAKARGEMLVCGSYFSPGGKPVTASFVRARLGSIEKRLAVAGDRVWQNQVPTPPQPFTTMPLDWAHAFGGASEPRNPYGKGAAPIPVQSAPGQARSVQPLPNVETFGAMMRAPNERPTPAGFLPMDVTFAQRRARAGSFDKRYLEEFFPGMPADMDPMFFNVAPEDQWAPGFFRGDEDFLLENMHPEQPRVEGRLPGLGVRVFVTLLGDKMAMDTGSRAPSNPASSSVHSVPTPPLREVTMRCDTVWLFPSAGFGAVVFHGTMPVAEDDAADVLHLVAACEDPASPRAIEHYQRALSLRLDKDKGALREMSDSDLMPPRESGVQANLRLTDMDIGRWTRSENLALSRGRRGQERAFANARARLEADGLDPKDYGLAELPAPPPEPPLDDLDALADYMEAQTASLDQQMDAAKAKAQEAKEQARAAFREMGKDYDEEMARAEKEGGGPPTFSATAHLTKLSAMAADAAAEGVPMDELEQHLSSPRYWEELKAQEQGLRDMYRRFAHLQPAARRLDTESSERVRTLVQIARDADESLAGRDFTGADLSGMDLSGVDLEGAFLEHANLAGCDLTGAALKNAVLARANLHHANLRGAQLQGANLGAADLRGAVFEDAQMNECVLARADLDGARLLHANLSGSDWLEAKPGAAALSGSNLSQCTFLKADFSGARFEGADLSDATFVECQLDEADFSRATMTKTTFVTCRGASVSFRNAVLNQAVFVHGSLFPDADFTGASMERANLRGTLLTGAKLDRARLQKSDLSECDASGASFEQASMQGGLLVRTRFEQASLRGANWMEAVAQKATIAGADFTGANLYRADLSRAVRDADTSFAEAKIERIRTLPKAETPPRRGAS
ncbi:MAG: DUF2169 domain-containing protein [Polyangiaceae bacterium]